LALFVDLTYIIHFSQWTVIKSGTARLHQEESRSISENVTWGQRKRFSDGKVNLPYKQFLDYEKGENGLPKIVEKEAVVVRLIYKRILEGGTPAGISNRACTLHYQTLKST